MRLAFVLHAAGCDIAAGAFSQTYRFQDGFITDDLTKVLMNALKQGGMQPDSVRQVLTVRGPGSFTAIRTALATAQGIAFANHCQVFAPTRFEVLAYNCRNLKDPVLLTAATFRGDYVCQWSQEGALQDQPFIAMPGVIGDLAPQAHLGDWQPDTGLNEAVALGNFRDHVRSPQAYYDVEPYYVVPLPYRPAAG